MDIPNSPSHFQESWTGEQIDRARLVLRQRGTEADFSHTLAGLVESLWGLGELSFERGAGRDRMDIFAPNRRVIFELKRPGLESWGYSAQYILSEHSAQLAKYMVGRRGEWMGVLSNSRKWLVWVWNGNQPGEVFFFRPRKPDQLCSLIVAVGQGPSSVASLSDPSPQALGQFDGGVPTQARGSGCMSTPTQKAAVGAIVWGIAQGSRRRRRGSVSRRLIRELLR